MNVLYMLIGVPGSGKSTWISKQEWAKDCRVVSTDKYVQEYAKWTGKTYTEVFKDYMPKALELMTSEVAYARENNQDVIWDQTSTTVSTRAKKFSMLPDYYTIAVVLRTPNRDELDVRLSGRPGKHIPKDVVDSMIANWEEPTEDEGFDEIWYVD